MTHPSETELALYTAGDLNWVKQRLTGRHVANCGECQSVVVEYSEFRAGAREFPKLPAGLDSGQAWSRLAAEMSANIRLGIEAGECVSPRTVARSRAKLPVAFGGALSWQRFSIACGVVAMAAGITFIVSHPPSLSAPPAAGTVLEASESGLQMSEGARTLRLLNTSGTEVTRTVGARGEVGARYLDENGYVTVSQVYGQ